MEPQVKLSTIGYRPQTIKNGLLLLHQQDQRRIHHTGNMGQQLLGNVNK